MRTSSTISATTSRTPAGGGASARIERASSLVSAPALEASSKRSTRTDALHQLVDLPLSQLVSYAIRHQPCRALADHLANLQLVLVQRPAGGSQVHDAVCQPCKWGKLDRSLYLDHLCLPPA